MSAALEANLPGMTPVPAAPNATPAEPTSAANDPYAALREPNGKFFGKYDTWDEAQKGVWNLTNHASQVENQLTTVLKTLATSNQPAAAPSEDIWKKIETEYAIPGGLLRQAVREEATRLADETVKTKVEPYFQIIAAKEQIAQMHPDYAKIQPAVEKHVQDNPMYAAMFNNFVQSGNYLGALDWAIRAYKMDRQNTPTPPSPTAQAARGAAALPGPVARVNTPDGPGDAQVEQDKAALFVHAQRTGELGPWAAKVLGNTPLTYAEQIAAEMQKLNQR